MSAGRDPGQPNERTGLAWQRTLLSALASGVLVARLVAGYSTTLAVGVGLIALLGTAVLGGLALSRFRQNRTALDRERVVGDGRPFVLLSALVVATSLGALLYVATA